MQEDPADPASQGGDLASSLRSPMSTHILSAATQSSEKSRAGGLVATRATRIHSIYPPGIKHGMLENGPFISHVPIKTSVHRGFSVAMFDYQRLTIIEHP